MIDEITCKTKKWGGSLGIIIPKEVVEKEHIKPNEELRITIRKLPLAKDLWNLVSDEIFVEALLFRQRKKKRDLSYADAIGYVFAKHHNLLFLTGDKAFKDLPSVEFVR